MLLLAVPLLKEPLSWRDLLSVLAKRQRLQPLPAMLMYSLSALLCFTVMALALGRLELPSLRSWLLLLLLGGGANGLGYPCWILALFRGQPVRPLQLAALILILAGPRGIYSVHRSCLI